MAYKRFFFSFFLVFFTLKVTPAKSHAVYVSVCNVYEKNSVSFFSMRLFKDDVFDALGLKGYSGDLSEVERKSVIKYIKNNFIVSVDGRRKNLVLDRFVFEGSDYTETANLVFIVEESLGGKKTICKKHSFI